MKKIWLAVALASTLAACGSETEAEKKEAVAEVEAPAAAEVAAPAGVQLETEVQKLSYGVGLMLGGQLRNDIGEIDLELLTKAIDTIYKDEEPLMTQEDVQVVMQAFQERKMEEQRQLMAKMAQEELEKGEAYLAENAKVEGVMVTESGLQYQVLTAAEGDKPFAEDTVKVHYRGTLIDGTEFDSSYSRNEPVSFPLNGVIAGWTEGLQLMNVGSKVRFVIPSDLAYGPGGAGQAIPPNATLVFEVELLEINPEEG